MQSKRPLLQTRHSKLFCALFISLLMGACKNYSVSVNDNLVYIPPPVFKDFAIADQQLFNCVQQTIYDAKITRAEDLTTLNCSNAGIKSLEGLQKFYALKELNLAENQIADIKTIGNLGRLKIVKLNDNRIKNAAPLLHLLHLEHLNLQNNPIANCKDLIQLIANQNNTAAELLLPVQCTK